MTQTQSLPFSFVDMNGTASRKRGWLVFAATLTGIMTVALVADSQADNTQLFTVPAGHIIFMGDNRDNSFDSRFSQTTGGVGFAPMDSVTSRVSRIVFSSAGTSMLDLTAWRAGRYWKAVE